MRKRSTATIVAVVIALASTLLAAGPAQALNSSESSFLSLTNRERSSRDIKQLALASDLTSIAREHSARMARDGKIYHNERLASDVDGGWRALGENVGKGPSARAIHEAFMNSAPHRAHILDGDFDQIGVGTVTRGDVIYVTEVFADRSRPKVRVVRSAPPRVVRRSRKPATPKPAPQPEPQLVTMLLLLGGLDADAVDPRTGVAISAPAVVTMRRTPP